jgi:hypothetical protein
MESLIKEHRKKGLLAAFIFLLMMVLFFFLVSLKEPDPPLQEKVVEVEVDIPPVGGSSGGSSEAKKSNNKSSSAQNLATEKESNVQVDKGDGNDKKTNNQNNNADSWMNMGANGGQNGGQDGGDDFGAGGGPGDNVGGGGSKGPRTMYGSPSNCLDVEQVEGGKVYLILWVNANGKIVRAENNASKSTTGSQNLISLAKNAVKNCVTFEKRPGTPDQKIVLAKPVSFIVK